MMMRLRMRMMNGTTLEGRLILVSGSTLWSQMSSIGCSWRAWPSLNPTLAGQGKACTRVRQSCSKMTS